MDRWQLIRSVDGDVNGSIRTSDTYLKFSTDKLVKIHYLSNILRYTTVGFDESC
jgi:hypothetical protein